MSRLLFITLLAVSLASATPLSTYHGSSRDVQSISFAPLLDAEHPHGTVNGSYIVVLKDGIEPTLVSNHMNFLQNVHAADAAADAFTGLTHVYDTHVKGYAGRFSDFVLDHIRSMPEVAFVERDQIVRTLEVERGVDMDAEGSKTQNGAPWVSHTSCLSERGRCLEGGLLCVFAFGYAPMTGCDPQPRWRALYSYDTRGPPQSNCNTRFRTLHPR